MSIPMGKLTRQQEALLKELEDRENAEKSFYEFVKQSWHTYEGDKPFVNGWHIGAIAEHLEAVALGQIRNLLINVPPRSSKSSLVSVAFVPWIWITTPSKQFLYSSYSANISIRDSVKCRRVMESPWFQARWGKKFKLVGDQNTKSRFINNKAGYRIATSTGGTATGDGANFLISDDANSALEANSDTKRDSTNAWFDQVWGTRLNDPKTDCKIVVQQRLHANDISGHIMNNDDSGSWICVVLPMEYEASRKCKTIILPSTNGKVWEDPREIEGELLCPERVGEDELKKLKQDLGSQYTISGQLQQNPAPSGGGIIKKDWFKWWKHSRPPQIEHVILSIDTALEAKEDNAYSAALTLGLFKNDYGIMNLMLLSMMRAKLEYPELRRLIQRMALDYRDDNLERPIRPDGAHKPDVVLIEAKASGISLIQDLMRAGIIATRFDPTKHGDKIQRVRLITHLLENGKVWVPAKPPDYTKLRPFADITLEQLRLFPNSESRDITDCLTQCLLRLSSSGWLVNTYDDDLSDTSVKAPTRALY